MEAAEESSSYSGCLACCWLPGFLLLTLLVCCFLRLWQGRFQVLRPTQRDLPKASSQGCQEVAPGGQQDGDSPRSQRRRSIRRLLCDNPACVVCEQAAAEASDLAYPRGLGLGRRPTTHGPLVPRAGRGGCSSARPTWGPWLRSASEPPSACGPGLFTSGRRVCCRRRGPAAGFCSGAACGSSSPRSTEGSHRSTSSLAGSSFSPRTEGGNSSSFSSRQSSFHWFSLTVESKRVSASGRKSVSVSEAKGKSRRRRGGEISHGTAPQGKGKPQREPTTPQTLPSKSLGTETPFLGAEARGGLEWHLLRKRFQHALGLPLALLQSLRAFMPPAPDSADRKPLRMMALVAPQVQPQPQPLPFLEPMGCRGELERHLKRRVTLRRWGLLQRVQGPLRAMQPGGVPLVPQTGQQSMRSHLEPPSTPRGAELASPAQPFLVGHPNCSTARKTPFPPGLLAGQRLSSADLEALESHILKKRLEHQWGLPGLVSFSLKQLLPAAPGPTASHTSLQCSLATRRKEDIQTICCQLPFVQPETKRELERHVRRLRMRRQWGLPKRVAASLPGSRLVPSASEGKPIWSSPSPRRPQGERPPLGPRPASLQVDIPGGPPAAGTHGDPKGQALQRHLTKKVVEIRLGIFPRMVCCSCTPHSWAGRPALPQVILPGQGAVELRRKDLLFVEQAALSHIELNIAHKRLAYQWGLPTLYTKSLARLCPTVVPAAAALGSPTDRPTPWVTFAATETRFVASEAREQLEWHMKKKQMQHLWGLPGLVQRSLARLFPEAPWLGQRSRGQVEAVATPWGRPSFLSQETWQRLEANVWKRIVLQRWGLPRMVLHSLRMLFPEKRGLPPPGGRERMRRTRRAIQPKGRLPHRPAGRRADPLLEHKDAREIEHHLTKKSVEIYLGALPRMARISWQLTQCLQAGQPLPRLIGPGHGTRCPRSRFLPFLRGEDLERVELAIRRRHLSFLWGLGPCQVGIVEAMRAPGQSTPTPRPRARRIEFSAVPAPFLAQSGREVLDLHLRRKRMQHQWGLPLFLQRSLRAFTQAPPPLPPPSLKVEVEVQVVQRDVLSLPESTRALLEAHVQKRKVHRYWGLPRRALGPLKQMSPKTRGPDSSPKGVPTHSHPATLADLSHGGSLGSGVPDPVAQGPGVQGTPRRPATPPPPAQSLVAAQALEEIRLRLAQKYVEEQLGIFPALVQHSRRDASLHGKEPLPKLIPPGRGTPQTRCCLLTFQRREDVERIELAVRHVHMVFLYRGARRQVSTRSSSAPLAKPRKRKAWVFTGVTLPFLQEEAKAALEEHVKKKRFRHVWRLLATTQKSLGCLMHQPPPSSITLCQKRSALLTVCIQRREPPIFLPPVHQGLERHVQKMKAQRLWGLPRRILQSLNIFTPSGKKKPESKATNSLGRPGRPRSKERGSRNRALSPVQALTVAGTAAAAPVAQRRVVRQHRKGARGKQKK